jgi:hypothetical protein
VGYGANADAGHLTHPDLSGVKSCMALALADAGLAPEAVGYVNAHGTGTAANDSTEARAIAELFGAHASRLLVSSTKAVHGHTMGAAGALETVATVLALATGQIPPTANFVEADPDLPPLDFVPDCGRKAAIESPSRAPSPSAATMRSWRCGGWVELHFLCADTRRRMRRTKIVATIGPASRDRTVLESLLVRGQRRAELSSAHEEHRRDPEREIARPASRS